MPKKGNGRGKNWEGSYWERPDGRYNAELPYLGPDGAKYYVQTTKRDEDEIKRWLNKKRYERDEGLLRPPEDRNLTVALHLRRWLATSVEGTVSRHTLRDYRDKVEKHLIPAFGKKKLKDLSRQDLQLLYRGMTARGYAAATVRHVHVVIGKALHEAEAEDLVRKNVARFVRPPKPDRTEREPMSTDEVRVFLRALDGHKDRALYLLAVTGGLRRGELFGLKWSDLDPDRGRLKVRRSLDTLYGPAEENDPKRKSSERPVVLLPEVVAALRKHKLRQHQDRWKAGPRWEENGYVFPTNRGTPQRADNVLKRSLKPFCAGAGLRPLTFTDLRHSCATFLAFLGVHPKTAQKILGHSSIAVTMNYYTHVLDEMHEDAASRYRKFLFGDEEGAEN